MTDPSSTWFSQKMEFDRCILTDNSKYMEYVLFATKI